MNRSEYVNPDNEPYGHKPFGLLIQRVEEMVAEARDAVQFVTKEVSRVKGEEKEMFRYALEKLAECVPSVVELEMFVPDLKQKRITRFWVERMYWLSAYLLWIEALFDGMFDEKWEDLTGLYVELRTFSNSMGIDLKAIAQELEKYLDPLPAIAAVDERASSSNHKSELHTRTFPPNTGWEDVTIRFLDDESVFIMVKDQQFETTFEAMGFMDKRRNRPNEQWRLLMRLASHGGELSWRNNNDLGIRERTNMKKQKQLLTVTLKRYFPFESEPFHEYRGVKAYRIRIKLTPSLNVTSVLSHNMKHFDHNTDDPLGIKDAYSSQARSVYLDEKHPKTTSEDSR